MSHYVTTFCNRAHDMSDGKPIAHECRILPVAALAAERAGDCDLAIDIMQRSPIRYMRRGKRSPKVAS